MYHCEELPILINNNVQQVVLNGRSHWRELKYRFLESLMLLAEGMFMHDTLNFSGKETVLKFISENNIKILNLCHIPEEGRLKTLSFSTANKDRVHDILEFGERVDGSSLFSFIDPAKSDIYISPRLGKAFANPFAILPTLNILCEYLDENGKPLNIAPENVLAKAEEKLRSPSGIALKALAELEFYIIAERQTETLFPSSPDKNYHESSSFAKFEDIRNEVLATLDVIGVPTKYGHGEVGRAEGSDGKILEQHEIEFAPENLSDMADTIAVSKWVIRNVCLRHGVSVSFVPKIGLNHAGSGMHVHMCALKDGKNIVVNHKGDISIEALRMIGGLLKFAPSLAAFGNPTPVSYLRLIARSESPMHICWSARNRLALIRIPLWWKFKQKIGKTESCRETFEYRAPDAFANAQLLFAGLVVAANFGLENSRESLKIAEDLHADPARHEEKRFRLLPRSCAEAAKNLAKDRKYYEAGEVFPRPLIDKTISKLNSYKDGNLWKELSNKPEAMQKALSQYLQCG
jgi:glutamine synthetase